MSDAEQVNRRGWVRAAVEQFESPLVRYAAQLIGNVEAAREVVQDTFLRLWHEQPGELDGRLAAWLYTVCRNRALDIRTKEHRMLTLTGEQMDACDNLANRQSYLVETTDMAEHVIGLVGDLPENQREVLRLKFQAGLSYKEISQVTQLSVSNVGYLLHTAIKKLREQLKTSECLE